MNVVLVKLAANRWGIHFPFLINPNNSFYYRKGETNILISQMKNGASSFLYAICNLLEINYVEVCSYSFVVDFTRPTDNILNHIIRVKERVRKTHFHSLVPVIKETQNRERIRFLGPYSHRGLTWERDVTSISDAMVEAVQVSALRMRQFLIAVYMIEGVIALELKDRRLTIIIDHAFNIEEVSEKVFERYETIFKNFEKVELDLVIGD